MDSPADLIDRACAELLLAVELTARCEIESLEASRGALQRSAQQLGAAVQRLAADPGSHGADAHGSLARFRATLRAGTALHQSAGVFCAEWARALQGLGGQSYSPAGAAPLPPPISAGRSVCVEA